MVPLQLFPVKINLYDEIAEMKHLLTTGNSKN